MPTFRPAWLTGALFATGMLLVMGAGCARTDSSTEEPSATAQEALAKPRATVRWSPSSLAVTLAPGETKQFEVSVIALENISATSVKVAAPLAGYVTVNPNHLPALRKGGRTSLTVKVVAPASAAAGTVSGDVSLYKGNGCGKGEPALCSALDVTVTLKEAAAQVVERLEATGTIPVLDRSDGLAGPDANANGIRDDVDAYIDGQHYEDSKRHAVEQLAQALQSAVTLQPMTLDAALPVSEQMLRATNCVGARFPIQEGYQLGRTFEKFTANTELRVRAYLSYNSLLSGTGSTLPTGDTCAN